MTYVIKKIKGYYVMNIRTIFDPNNTLPTSSLKGTKN